MSNEKAAFTFLEAANWFGKLSRFAKDIKRTYVRADNQANKAEVQLRKAMQLALEASEGAYNLVGDTPAESLVPTDKDSQLDFWQHWSAQIFEEVFEEVNRQQPKKDDDNGEG